jgi:hypothetical protein
MACDKVGFLLLVVSDLMFEVRGGKIQAIREYVDTFYTREVLFS